MIQSKIRFNLSLLVVMVLLVVACKSGPFNLIKPSSPHNAYERKLISAGLDQTVMGAAWITKAKESLEKSLPINLPYQERGYFAADKIESAVFNFHLQRGQKLIVQLQRKLPERFKVYVDVLRFTENKEIKHVGSVDTLGNALEIAIDNTGTYLIRLQPELLSSGEYTLSLTTGPSLNFPLNNGKTSQIQSVFGDGRDANTRKHEGIDIFAPFRTPVIAVSPGRVTSVNENNLGGKVVWFRPEGKDYTLYYAHLDEQTVSTGQVVNYGDTLGRMGNTGNAKTTAPHLHFGIYSTSGAIDPFPFVNPKISVAPEVLAPTSKLNSSMRTISKVTLQNGNRNELEKGTLVYVSSASENTYRVELPDGSSGYVLAKHLVASSNPLKNISISQNQLDLFENPDSLSAIKLTLKKGDKINVLGYFAKFQFVEYGDNLAGWIKK